ncbi:MAG: hypothetical protein ABEJ72_05365 [Candidatus Aenigmatarchaeota archaeon]
MYEDLKKAVENLGEVMVRMDSGKEIELHNHNVQFMDGRFKVETGTEVYWFDADKIESYWIHKGI